MLQPSKEPYTNLATPPQTPVEWTAKCRDKTAVVTARTWMDARDQAMCLLGCGQNEITVTQCTP